MSILLWALYTPAAPVVVIGSAAGFLAWLGWRGLLRWVDHRLDVAAGPE